MYIERLTILTMTHILHYCLTYRYSKICFPIMTRHITSYGCTQWPYENWKRHHQGGHCILVKTAHRRLPFICPCEQLRWSNEHEHFLSGQSPTASSWPGLRIQSNCDNGYLGATTPTTPWLNIYLIFIRIQFYIL